MRQGQQPAMTELPPPQLLVLRIRICPLSCLLPVRALSLAVNPVTINR